MRSLTSTEVQLPQLSQQIAKHVAAFHKLTLPLSKEGTWFLDSLAKLELLVFMQQYQDFNGNCNPVTVNLFLQYYDAMRYDLTE